MKNIYLVIIFLISIIALISRQLSNYPFDNVTSAILSIYIFVLFLFLISKYDKHVSLLEKKNNIKKRKKLKKKSKKKKRKKEKKKKTKKRK